VRPLVIALGLAYVVVAAVLFALRIAPIALAAILAVNGLIVIGAILIERSRYRPEPAPGSTHVLWRPTGERFVDPASGQMIEVQENTVTGERIYQEVEQ
jgi:hypothetical protein